MTKAAVLVLAAMLLAMPALAQVDFSGEWAPLYHENGPERLPGPELGDYTELPINDAARLRADSWDADRISVVEQYQCRPHGSDYALRGLGNMRVTRDIDAATQRLTAFHTHMLAWDSDRTIYMDGRAHPPDYANHTWQGFSTAVWEGNMLTVTTTHVKQGWQRRENIPASDEVTVIEHYIRRGNMLTHISVTEDPVFLDEPLIKSEEFALNPDPNAFNPFWPCEYIEEGEHQRGEVPSYFAGENPWIAEYAATHDLPQEATLGGAATMYPEYRARLKVLPKAVHHPQE